MMNICIVNFSPIPNFYKFKIEFLQDRLNSQCDNVKYLTKKIMTSSFKYLLIVLVNTYVQILLNSFCHSYLFTIKDFDTKLVAITKEFHLILPSSEIEVTWNSLSITHSCNTIVNITKKQLYSRLYKPKWHIQSPCNKTKKRKRVYLICLGERVGI